MVAHQCNPSTLKGEAGGSDTESAILSYTGSLRPAGDILTQGSKGKKKIRKREGNGGRVGREEWRGEEGENVLGSEKPNLLYFHSPYLSSNSFVTLLRTPVQWIYLLSYSLSPSFFLGVKREQRRKQGKEGM